jgi:hypothetical protein
MATFAFSTLGVFPPQDVGPLAANPAQYPMPLAQEASYLDGVLIRNPRDMLVTLLAWTHGEEHFFDDNNNGVHDPGERFVDQAEPFVDANDNDRWDPGESFVDTNLNGVWDGPNGVWDGSTNIWVTTHVLYTGATLASQSFTSPASFDVAHGATTSLELHAPDVNLNRAVSGSLISMAQVGARGTARITSDNSALDGYGFALLENALTNAAGTAPCDATTPICRSRTVFGTWDVGLVGTISIQGAATTDLTGPTSLQVNLTRTVSGFAVPLSVSGTIE